MDKKVVLQDLAERVAQRKGLPKKDAELFVRSVFEIIGEYLQADKIVKVKGLGTFKLVTMESRASVDVNTGERITIKGYTKISFTPDAVLRDEINKPFAQFETVVLNEGTSVEEMERMDMPELPDLPLSESVEEAAENVVETVDVPEDIAPVPEEDQQPELVEVETHPEEISVETAAIEENVQEESLAAPEEVKPEKVEVQPEKVEVQPEKIDVQPEKVEVQPEKVDVQPEKVTDTIPEHPVQASPEPSTDTYVETSHVVNQKVEYQKVEHQTVENQHIVQMSPEHAEGKSSLSAWAWAGICAVVILLMCGSYYAGHKHLLFPGECDGMAEKVTPKVEKDKGTTSGKKVEKVALVEKPVQQAVAPTDTLQTKKEEKPVEIVEKQYPQVEGGKYEIVGVRETLRLKAGETLRGLALEHYGSKNYVEYIIVFNDIKNPDVVPVGMELKLPELKLKPR